MADLLTDAEKASIRAHLGYPNVSAVATFALGTPAAIETAFILERAFLLILPEAVGIVRELVGKCDAAEAQFFENMENLAVDEVGSIKLRKDEAEKLMGPAGRYATFREKLANQFGISPNPYDKRQILGGSINAPVVG